MKLNRATIRMLGLLAVLAAAVVWSQMPAAPRTAQAAAKPTSAPGTPGTTTAPVVDVDEVLHRFQARSTIEHDEFPSETARDLFARPRTASADSMVATTEPSTGGTDKSPDQVAARDPAPNLRLDGVISGNAPIASINGRLYRKGAIIDGYTIADIGQDFVRLRKQDREFDLFLDRSVGKRPQ